MGSEYSFEYLSEEAYERFKRELDYLVRERRKEISERLKSARELGDISENAEYQEAKEEQLAVESRIAELEDLLSRAQVIPQNGRTSAAVALGCSVVLQKEGNSETVIFRIVGSEEVDTLQMKISDESPLGAAIIGKAKGETVKVITPGGSIEYTIIEIS